MYSEYERQGDIEIDLLRAEYEIFDYDLPVFDKIIEDFDVEKAFEKETSF